MITFALPETHKNTSRILAPVLGALILGLTACGGGSSTTPPVVTPTPTPTPTPPPTASLALSATLGGTDIFPEDGGALSFVGGETLSLEIISNQAVTTATLTQSAGPLVTYGRVSVGGLSAGGSIVAGGSGTNFTFNFPDDDDTPRRAVFPVEDGPVRLEVIMPSVSSSTAAEFTFALSDGTESATAVVPFTITASSAGAKPANSMSVSGTVSHLNSGDTGTVTVYDIVPNAQEMLSVLAEATVTSDGTYNVSIERDRIQGDSLLVFMASDSTSVEYADSYVVTYGIPQKGMSEIVPVSAYETDIIAELSSK